MKFDIQHAAAAQTVRSTSSTQDTVSAELAAGNSAASELAGSLQHSQVVSDAVESLRLEVFDPSADDALSRIGTATSSTSQALGHYEFGDQEMGQNSSSSNSGAEVDDIPGVR